MITRLKSLPSLPLSTILHLFLSPERSTDIMNHRKLISETVVYNLTTFCAPFCDPTENIYGLCPEPCYTSCPSACFNTPQPCVTITAVHHKDQKLHKSLVISLSLVGLACFVYCMFMVYKYIKNKRRRTFQEEMHDHGHDRFVDEEHGPVLDHPIWYIRTVGLQPSTIDLITVVKYKRDEGLVEGTDCSVCLSEFQDDETLRLLPKCNHAFHLPCIDMWLGSHTNCPMCRAPIVSSPNGTLLPVLEPEVVLPEEIEERERENGLEPKGVGSSQNGVQPMRRSVSMDSLAALRLTGDIANAQLSETNMEIVPKRLNINQGLVRFLGGSSFKRSFSCSGKVLFSRHNRDRNSVLPP